MCLDPCVSILDALTGFALILNDKVFRNGSKLKFDEKDEYFKA